MVTRNLGPCQGIEPVYDAAPRTLGASMTRPVSVKRCWFGRCWSGRAVRLLCRLAGGGSAHLFGRGRGQGVGAERPGTQSTSRPACGGDSQSRVRPGSRCFEAADLAVAKTVVAEGEDLA